MKYLAFDIGAGLLKARVAAINSVGNIEVIDSRSVKIGREKKDGHILWALDEIIESIRTLLIDMGPADSILIDSFASDFILLDADDEIVGGAVSYLDERTKRIKNEPDSAKVFKCTGSHSRPNNTLYQLVALKEEESELLEKAESLLFLPDYINYCLTGVKKSSLSMALTSSLVNIESLDWDAGLLAEIGIKRSIFQEIVKDGTVLGDLKEDIAKEAGYNAKVLVSSHDTSLAYISAPLEEGSAMLSVGGFARLGVIVDEAILSDDAMQKNYTNAVSPLGDKTLTKYLMGTYLIQNLKGKMKEGTSYDEIMKKARSIHSPCSVDIAKIGYETDDVMGALNAMLENPSEDPFEAASIIYSSLAEYYISEIGKMEETLSHSINRICLVGGAAKDPYLALLIAMKSGKMVVSTSCDAALIGNLAFQMICSGELRKEEKDTAIMHLLGRTSYLRS